MTSETVHSHNDSIIYPYPKNGNIGTPLTTLLTSIPNKTVRTFLIDNGVTVEGLPAIVGTVDRTIEISKYNANYSIITVYTGGAKFCVGRQYTTTITWGPLLPTNYNQRIDEQTCEVDISNFQNATAYAFFVMIRSWAALDNYFSLYLVQGIQNGLYQGVTQIARGTENTSKVELKDANTIKITFYNSAGGHYTIIPIMK